MSEEIEEQEDEALGLDEVLDAPELIRKVYQEEGVPDFWSFKAEILDHIPEMQLVENDYWLSINTPVPMFGASIGNVAKGWRTFKERSGYNAKTFKYRDFVEKYRPSPGETVGGKGLTSYTHPVVYLTGLMSKFLNINISYGCPGLCVFCKESNLARNYTQMQIEEETGIIEFDFEGETIKVEGMSRVKFWDTDNNLMVYGPLQVAIANKFPISKYSLRKLAKEETFRVLSD